MLVQAGSEGGAREVNAQRWLAGWPPLRGLAVLTSGLMNGGASTCPRWRCVRIRDEGVECVASVWQVHALLVLFKRVDQWMDHGRQVVYACRPVPAAVMVPAMVCGREGGGRGGSTLVGRGRLQRPCLAAVPLLIDTHSYSRYVRLYRGSGESNPLWCSPDMPVCRGDWGGAGNQANRQAAQVPTSGRDHLMKDRARPAWRTTYVRTCTCMHAARAAWHVIRVAGGQLSASTHPGYGASPHPYLASP